MACFESNTCQKYGNAPAGCRGAWTTRGVKYWNHVTELLKQHMRSQWHRDAAVTAAMAEQTESGGSILELQCSSAVWEAAKRRQKNREVLLNVMWSVYFLVKNRIPHITVFLDLIELLVANGDTLLEKHLRENPANAPYTSKFISVSMIEAVDTWVERKLLESLKASPFFSILADKCQDVSTQE